MQMASPFLGGWGGPLVVGQKVPYWFIKIMVLEEVETTTRSGI